MIKVLIDAQLPELLSDVLNDLGMDSMHVLQLDKRDETPDKEVAAFADRTGRTVVTKDSDFLHSYTAKQSPKRLMLIMTGNIKNRALLDLFRNNILKIKSALQRSSYVEIDNFGIIEK